MNAGKLRNLVTVESPTIVRSTSGAVSKTWATFAETWASIEGISGREAYAAKEFTKEATHKVRLRHVSGLTSEMRVVFGTRTFDVLHAENTDERNVEWVLICKEGVSKGN